MTDVTARFQKFVSPQVSGCWHWTGAKTAKGYGRFHLNGNKHAHRISYEMQKGAIPEGLVLDHLCRNPCRVNPDHLEPVTHVESVKRGDHVAKGWKREVTHCPSGHEYSAENTYIEKRNGGGASRHCKACMSARQRSKN